MMKRLIGLLMAILMLFTFALAESVDTIDVCLTSEYVCRGDGVQLLLTEAEGPARITLVKDGILLLDEDCGNVSGRFVSRPIYLDENGEYSFCLTLGEQCYYVTVLVERSPIPTEIGWL